MKQHKRVGTWLQNCFTLTQKGFLEKGILVDQYNEPENRSIAQRPAVDLKQGISNLYKGLSCWEVVEQRGGFGGQRVYNACFKHFDGQPTLVPRNPNDREQVMLYIPSLVELSFGAGYHSPLLMTQGPVVFHPQNRVRDGNFVLGEAWEDDKTSAVVLEPDMKVMVSSRRWDGDKGYFVRVVTIARSENYLIMRYPRSAEMLWFDATMKEIRAEEHSRRMSTDGVYRSRMT